MGYVDHYLNMPALYEKAYLTLVPSFAEACSLVTLESLSSGCPVVAQNILGMNEILSHKVNGLLLQPDIDLWCKSIVELASDIELYNTVRKQGLLTIYGKYSLIKSIDKYMHMWTEVIKND